MLITEMPLDQSILLLGKSVDVSLSESALDALSRRTKPLSVEMELYFSCLIRKKVRFHNAGDDVSHKASENEIHDPQLEAQLFDRLQIRFRPVMTKVCGKDYEGEEPPLTEFPITNIKAYIPHWLKIDYQKKTWTGEFGYHSKN